MPISLQKGQKVSLTKGNPGLTKVVVGLGWDVNSFDTGGDFDLDAAAFLLGESGKVTSSGDFVFYGNLKHSSGAVEHLGDNLTGEGAGDDEQIRIDLTKVPDNIQRIAFTVTIYEAESRRQNFGMVNNAFIRIFDETNGQEMLRYDLGEDFSIETAAVFGEVYKNNGEWKFNAIRSLRPRPGARPDILKEEIYMSVSLQKGQKISLTKGNEGLSKVIIGLGWDEAAKSKGGLFGSLFGSSGPAIDCDASAFVLQNGKLTDKKDIVYFGNLKHYTGTVQHMGDNLTGAGEGDDEQIVVDLARVPAEYDRIVLVVNIYQAVQRRQHFGMIQNAFIRIVDARNNQEMCRYNLSENYDNMTAMIFGEVYRNNGEWKFNAIGQATTDPGLVELARRYM